MRKLRRVIAVLAVFGALSAFAPAVHADPPGGGSKPQCVPGHDPSNPHCPSHK